MSENELLPSSFFKQFRNLRSLQGCKRVDRNLMRYFAKHDRMAYYNMRKPIKPYGPLGFECSDYYTRGE